MNVNYIIRRRMLPAFDYSKCECCVVDDDKIKSLMKERVNVFLSNELLSLCSTEFGMKDLADRNCFVHVLDLHETLIIDDTDTLIVYDDERIVYAVKNNNRSMITVQRHFDNRITRIPVGEYFNIQKLNPINKS